MFRAVLAVCAVLACASTPVAAQTILTFETVVARAREQAAPIAIARARVAEAEAGVAGASPRFRDNPALEFAAGPRWGDGVRYTELDIGVSQTFETGGQREARLAGARALVDRSRADVDRIAREVVFDAASAFLDGLAAIERLQIAEDADTLSRDLLAATERRYAAGDIAAIDLNLARVSAARVAAALQSARADLTESVGALVAILRLPDTEPIELSGSLDVRPVPAADSLDASIARLPELAALEADLREAEAHTRLGHALARPDLGVRLGFEREEGDSIVIGGFTIALPTFQRGQGTLAAGVAHASRARIELDAARQTARARVRTARAVSQQRAEVARALADTALPGVVDNEQLARRSYEAGEISLMDYLLIRRDALDTRTAIVDRRLEAARSRLTVDFLAGVLR